MTRHAPCRANFSQIEQICGILVSDIGEK